MRGALIVLVSLAVVLALAKKRGQEVDPCDPSVIDTLTRSADARISAAEGKLTDDIEITRSTIVDWKKRIEEADAECAPHRFNCAAMLQREELALRDLERNQARHIDQLRGAKDREIAQAKKDCARSRETGSKGQSIKCNGGVCSCGGSGRLVRKDSILGEPIPDGCSVPSFLNADAFNSAFYDDYLHAWHKGACHTHDVCYATCGRTQSECDSAFQATLRSDCTALLNSLRVAEVLCPWLCDHEEEARNFFGENPSDPEHVCAPYVNRKACTNFSLKEMRRFVRDDCKRIANLFSMGVQMFGGRAFTDSQRNHCQCVHEHSEL